MRARRDPYVVFVSAKTVAFAWIGAMLFPVIVEMPYTHPMFWVCAGGGLLAGITIADGIRAIRKGQTSDFVVKTLVPAILLAAASAFVAIAA